MTAPDPFTTDALWSAGEVREQSQQVAGQLDVWDAIEEDDGGPCCYGFVTSAGQDHEYGCYRDGGR